MHLRMADKACHSPIHADTIRKPMQEVRIPRCLITFEARTALQQKKILLSIEPGAQKLRYGYARLKTR